MKRAGFLIVLVSLALTAPAQAAEPVCHAQFAPKTKAEQEQRQIESYMRQRAQFGFRADEAYVRELIERGVWEYDVGYIPVTPEENDYLRLRDRLDLGREAQRYISRRRDLSGGLSVEDDWPREPYLLLRLTRDRAAHEYNLRQLARFPDNLRTVEVLYSYRQLRRVQDRISRDWDALREDEGFDIAGTSPDIDTNTVEIDLITKRTDAPAYFRNRYGPVTVHVIATEPTYLDCEQADYHEVSRDGRRLTIHWTRSGSVESERIDLIEYPDRVEIGVVDRFPHGSITADAVGDERRVRLAQPLGDRVVVDMADGRPLIQHGPSPGEPACPVNRHTRLDDAIVERKEAGLPHGRAYVRRMLRREDPYTPAEKRYLRLYESLQFEMRVYRYERRNSDEFGGSSVEGRFPGKPYLVERFTRHIQRHARNLRRLTKHPDRLRVIRTRWTERELDTLAESIFDDVRAGDGFLDGFGDAGFFASGGYPERGKVVIEVRTPRDDAARYFRERYGPAVRVIVVGRRYECREIG